MNGNILIDKANLIHNLSEIKRYTPNSKIMSVIKSNGYGHGMLEISKILDDSDAFSVATMEEVIYLRENQVTKEIVCLQGFSNKEEYIYCSKNNIRPVVHNIHQVNIIDNTTLENSIKVWIKIDTGMNRLGFKPQDFQGVYQKLNQSEMIKQPIGVMTHLACADEDEDHFSNEQINIFTNTTKGIDTEFSIFNSAGIIRYSKKFKDTVHWLRPGLMLYGVNPCNESKDINLKPVMTLTAPVISINECKKGEYIGYGKTYRVEKNTRIAAIGIGYGDGLPRQLSNVGKVFFENNYFNIVGRISMDIIMIDIQDKEIEVGSNVELWGGNINIKDVSSSIETIPYELMCNLGNRLKKIYI